MEVTPATFTQPSTAGALRHKLYFGLQSRVGKSLGISRGFVTRVMQGKRTSKRVSDAIAAEITRIEHEVTAKAHSKPYRPLTAEQLAAFRRGGRYFGLQALVASQHGTSRQIVGMVARGDMTNPALLQALREAMAGVDVRISAAAASSSSRREVA